MKEADFKAKVEAQGYKIKNFKVTKNDCYDLRLRQGQRR